MTEVVLCREPANALDFGLLKELLTCLAKIESDEKCTCVLLKSKFTPVFSSGLDLRGLTGLPGDLEKNIITGVKLVYKLVKRIANSNKIYVAVLKGAVIGSAVSLAAACDFRFAAPATWFWVPDPQFGGLLADGGLMLIERICGMASAKKMCLTNERINCGWALEHELLHAVVQESEIDFYVDKFVNQLLAQSRNTLRYTKALINQGCPGRFYRRKLWKVLHAADLPERLKKYNLYGGAHESE